MELLNTLQAWASEMGASDSAERAARMIEWARSPAIIALIGPREAAACVNRWRAHLNALQAAE